MPFWIAAEAAAPAKPPTAAVPLKALLKINANAAEELHITQQALSARIAAVEKELACKLIVRSNPLQLTYAGEVFLRYASEIYGNYQAMWNEFNDLTNNQRGKLLIGINFTRSHAIMPDNIAAFQAAYPNIEVRLLEGTNESLHKSLINKDIDLAIARFPESLPGMEIRDFYKEEVIMLVPAQLLPEEKRESGAFISDLSEFSVYPFILGSPYDISGQIARSMISNAGFQPIVKAQSANMETLLSLCAKGIGICFCPESLARAILTKEQLNRMKIYHFSAGASYHIRFGYRKESYQWKMISEFIRIALEQTKTMLY